jgi:aryl-alcohol dehydrogenase-like predicted oxidoreductase
MNYRALGKTGVQVSEIGFGAWAIGGAYGAVDKHASLQALAKAEELGCNFVDTAAVYGNSEEILGEFLATRRSQWLLATKYSGQGDGMEKTLEKQLRGLGTDYVDLYQIHWAPHSPAPYRELESLRESGKTRFIGVSLYNSNDIDYVLANTNLDSIQLPFSLLEPTPYLRRLETIERSGIAVIVRSCLKEGFLTGKFSEHVRFDDRADQRHEWDRKKIAALVGLVEQFRFLEDAPNTLALAAARYPLAFEQTSTVIMGTKSVTQADMNFGAVPQAKLNATQLTQIATLQHQLGLGEEPSALHYLSRRLREVVKKIIGSR